MEPVQKFDAFISTKDNHPHSHSPEQWHDDEPESHMLISQLESIIENAQELMALIQNKETIEDWIQSKITVAEDYLTVTRDYYKHRDR
jgi:hypothetical protein